MLKFLLLSTCGLALSSNDYEDRLFRLLKLEYKSSQSIENVEQILDQISQSAILSQEADDRLNTTRITECIFDIDYLDRPIEVLYTEISRTTEITTKKMSLFNATSELITKKTKEIEILSQTKEKLEKKYMQESDDLKTSYFNYEKSLKNLKEGYNILSQTDEFVNGRAIKDSRAHVEPVGFLFLQSNQDSYRRLTEIVGDATSDISNYLKENSQMQAELYDKYKEMTSLIGKITEDCRGLLNVLEEESLALADSIEEANRMRLESEEEYGSVRRAKDDKTYQCEVWRQEYAFETEKRNEIIKIVGKIREKIQQKGMI
jgi:hypothetical protein